MIFVDEKKSSLHQLKKKGSRALYVPNYSNSYSFTRKKSTRKHSSHLSKTTINLIDRLDMLLDIVRQHCQNNVEKPEMNIAEEIHIEPEPNPKNDQNELVEVLEQVPTELPKDFMFQLNEACEKKEAQILFNLLSKGNHVDNEPKVDNYEFIKNTTPIQVVAGVDVNTPIDDKKNTLLHTCARVNFETGVAILARCGANMNVKNEAGETPIHTAVFNEAVQALHLILKNGGDHNITDNFGLIPMQYAVRRRSEGCSNTLIEFGADVSLKYKRDERNFRKFTLNKFSDTGDSEDNDPSQYDAYGFLKEEEEFKPRTKLERQYARKYTMARRMTITKNPSRSKKWKIMLQQIERLMKKGAEEPRHPKLKSRVRKGIPNNIRSAAWKILLPIEKVKKENPGVYLQHLMTPSPHAKQIDVDILRSFRKHKLYRERYGKGQCTLYNVLKAYSNYNPQLGYCQGMCPITALLVLYLDEEDAFWALTILMSNPKYGMERIFTPGFPKLMECFYVHEQLLKKYIPKLYRHFSEIHMETSMYATRWYMLLMLENLPFDVAIRIWDIYFLEGSKVVFSLVLSLLSMYERELLKMDFEGVMKFFGTFEKRPIDVEKLINLATKHKVKNRVIQSIIAKYREIEKQKKKDQENKKNVQRSVK